jgi:ubiquinone/menaquinone biosynthesis C-methylase UbiE
MGEPAGYRKHYGEPQARHYAHAKEAAAATHRAEVELVERALRGVPRAESLLDLPCGAARMTVALAGLGFARLHAADVSPAMVELARARLAAEGVAAAVELADAERLPWPDLAFDGVFCFRLFHHFPTTDLREQVARELCRVARRRVIVSYLDARSFTSRKRALGRLLRPRVPSKFTQTPAEIAALFERAGFRRAADFARMPLVHSRRVLVAERRAT